MKYTVVSKLEGVNVVKHTNSLKVAENWAKKIIGTINKN